MTTMTYDAPPLEELLRAEMYETALDYGKAECDVTLVIALGGDWNEDPGYTTARASSAALRRRLENLRSWMPDNCFSTPPVPYRCQAAEHFDGCTLL
jgi:hypothetical protein